MLSRARQWRRRRASMPKSSMFVLTASSNSACAAPCVVGGSCNSAWRGPGAPDPPARAAAWLPPFSIWGDLPVAGVYRDGLCSLILRLWDRWAWREIKLSDSGNRSDVWRVWLSPVTKEWWASKRQSLTGCMERGAPIDRRACAPTLQSQLFGYSTTTKGRRVRLKAGSGVGVEGAVGRQGSEPRRASSARRRPPHWRPPRQATPGIEFGGYAWGPRGG